MLQLKDLGYIIFEDSSNPKTYFVGFNRYNDPGFIDDGAGWDDFDREQFEFLLISKIDKFIEPWESNSFTYFIHNIDGLKEELDSLGLTEQQQAWEE